MTTKAQDGSGDRSGGEPWLSLPELDGAWGPDSPITIARRLECAAWAIRHGYWDEASGLLGMAEHYSAGRRNTAGLWEQAKVGLAWCCWRSGNAYGGRLHLKDAIKSWSVRNLAKDRAAKSGPHSPFGSPLLARREFRQVQPLQEF